MKGKPILAFPEQVCQAVLEYYAFEADGDYVAAKRTHRILARAGLRKFVYDALGYSPDHVVSEAFRSFHQRLLLNQMPAGYFSVFSELSHFMLSLIRSGLPVGPATVPDISVGRIWSEHWTRSSASVRSIHTTILRIILNRLPKSRHGSTQFSHSVSFMTGSRLTTYQSIFRSTLKER